MLITYSDAEIVTGLSVQHCQLFGPDFLNRLKLLCPELQLWTRNKSQKTGSRKKRFLIEVRQARIKMMCLLKPYRAAEFTVLQSCTTAWIFVLFHGVFFTDKLSSTDSRPKVSLAKFCLRILYTAIKSDAEFYACSLFYYINHCSIAV